MLAYLKKHQAACRTILVEKTDRLYRNIKDYATIGEFDVDVHFVKETSRMIEKARAGICPSFAPAGYRNGDGPNGKRVIVVSDPDVAPTITEWFGRFATGRYSVKGLVGHAIAIKIAAVQSFSQDLVKRSCCTACAL
jgi:site-specific DNA recombinase